jgi:hypothetical protein
LGVPGFPRTFGFFAPRNGHFSPHLTQLATKLLPDFGSGNGNTTSLLALPLAAIVGWVFYKRLRGVDVRGLAEACVYNDVNEAGKEVRHSYRGTCLVLLGSIQDGNADLEQLKESRFRKMLYTMAEGGFISVDKKKNIALTRRGRRFYWELMEEAEQEIPTTSRRAADFILTMIRVRRPSQLSV